MPIPDESLPALRLGSEAILSFNALRTLSFKLEHPEEILVAVNSSIFLPFDKSSLRLSKREDLTMLVLFDSGDLRCKGDRLLEREYLLDL